MEKFCIWLQPLLIIPYFIFLIDFSSYPEHPNVLETRNMIFLLLINDLKFFPPNIILSGWTMDKDQDQKHLNFQKMKFVNGKKMMNDYGDYLSILLLSYLCLMHFICMIVNCSQFVITKNENFYNSSKLVVANYDFHVVTSYSPPT